LKNVYQVNKGTTIRNKQDRQRGGKRGELKKEGIIGVGGKVPEGQICVLGGGAQDIGATKNVGRTGGSP